MKITKTQIKEIIKEEIGRALNENESSFEELENDIMLSVSSINKGKMPMTPEEMQALTVDFVESAIYIVRRSLPSGLVSSKDFTTAVVRAAKEWVQDHE